MSNISNLKEYKYWKRNLSVCKRLCRNEVRIFLGDQIREPRFCFARYTLLHLITLISVLKSLNTFGHGRDNWGMSYIKFAFEILTKMINFVVGGARLLGWCRWKRIFIFSLSEDSLKKWDHWNMLLRNLENSLHPVPVCRKYAGRKLVRLLSFINCCSISLWKSIFPVTGSAALLKSNFQKNWDHFM